VVKQISLGLPELQQASYEETQALYDISMAFCFFVSESSMLSTKGDHIQARATWVMRFDMVYHSIVTKSSGKITFASMASGC